MKVGEAAAGLSFWCNRIITLTRSTTFDQILEPELALEINLNTESFQYSSIDPLLLLFRTDLNKLESTKYVHFSSTMLFRPHF